MVSRDRAAFELRWLLVALGAASLLGFALTSGLVLGSLMWTVR